MRSARLDAYEAIRIWKEWSRHAWLQPMHVLILCDAFAAALVRKNGSAKKGRAIETKSA